MTKWKLSRKYRSVIFALALLVLVLGALVFSKSLPAGNSDRETDYPYSSRALIDSLNDLESALKPNQENPQDQITGYLATLEDIQSHCQTFINKGQATEETINAIAPLSDMCKDVLLVTEYSLQIHTNILPLFEAKPPRRLHGFKPFAGRYVERLTDQASSSESNFKKSTALNSEMWDVASGQAFLTILTEYTADLQDILSPDNTQVERHRSLRHAYDERLHLQIQLLNQRYQYWYGIVELPRLIEVAGKNHEELCQNETVDSTHCP